MALVSLVARRRGSKWSTWADQDWFADRESKAEKILSDFFRPMSLPQPTAAVTAL